MSLKKNVKNLTRNQTWRRLDAKSSLRDIQDAPGRLEFFSVNPPNQIY